MKRTIKGEPFAFPTPVFIVASYNEDMTPNAMNAAWAGASVSNPPCITVSIQKPRKSYDNIAKTKEFTVNIPNEKYIKEADYFGMVSGHKTAKFEDTKLTAVKAEYVNAPYIEEFPINIECRVKQITEIGTHFIIIGEILNVIANEECFNENGKVTLENSGAVVYDPISRKYHKVSDTIGKAFSIGKEFINNSK